jgi:hypothetical protein
MHRFILILIILLFVTPAAADDSAAVSLYFISPSDGETVSSPVTVRFGLSGMGVAPAGSDVANTGHHHLLLDLDELPPMDRPLPKNANVIHFGGGQTETVLSLPPGEHRLQLLLGNASHIPHETPVISDQITITVSED